MMGRGTPLKIAQLGPAHPHRGGIVHFNSRLAKALHGRNDLDVTQFFWAKPYPESLLPGSPSNWLDMESKETFHVPGQSFLSYSNPLTWWRFVRQICKGGHDLLITHWVHPIQFPVFFTLFCALRIFSGTRIVLIVHNVLPHESAPGSKQMLRLIAKLVHRVIVHSSEELNNALSCKIPAEKIRLAFHPVFDFFPLCENAQNSVRNDLGLKDKVFLFFGFLRPYKGVRTLLSAFEKLNSRMDNVSLLIVGENFGAHNVTKIEFDITKGQLNKIKNVVHINKYVPNDSVGQYFMAADTLVAPYNKASQSGPIQIAYSFGKPVIASDIPSFRDCIKSGTSGYFFTAGDPDDLARVMEFFLGHPLDADDIRTFSRQFSWEKYTEILLDEAGPRP